MPSPKPSKPGDKFTGFSVPTDAATPPRLAELARKIKMSRSELARACVMGVTTNEKLVFAIAKLASNKGMDLTTCIEGLLTAAVRAEVARGAM